MNATEVFVEVVVNASEAAQAGIESRDEIEEPLEGALTTSGLGTVTGGGGGSGVYILDIEVLSDEKFDAALDVIRGVLRDLRVPASTRIKRHKPHEIAYPVYE